MELRKVYLYVFDTMSDWEIGYLTAEINTGRYFRKDATPVKLVTVGADKNPITTMGGMKVTPEISVEECIIGSGDMLILAGGETWTAPVHNSILEKASESLANGNYVAGICGATFGLAQKGLLDTTRHTSNDLGYLKMMIPNYVGESHYEYKGAVTDNNLITAAGIAPLEFTVEVMKALGVWKETTLDAWLNLYKTQNPKYFFELMNSMN